MIDKCKIVMENFIFIFKESETLFQFKYIY